MQKQSNSEANSEASLDVMKERLSELKTRIMTLEWDKSHNQLNSGMEAKYSQIKAECDELEKKVNGIRAELREQETIAENAAAAATAAEVKEQKS